MDTHTHTHTHTLPFPVDEVYAKYVNHLSHSFKVSVCVTLLQVITKHHFIVLSQAGLCCVGRLKVPEVRNGSSSIFGKLAVW